MFFASSSMLLRRATKAAAATPSSARAFAASPSSRWSSSDSSVAAESAESSAAGAARNSKDASASSNAAFSSPLNRKQRFAHRVPQPNQEALLQRPLSSSAPNAASSSSSSSPAQQFNLGDLASMSALLYHPDPILDSGHTLNNPATPSNPFRSSVTFYNSDLETGGSIFPQTPPSAASLVLSSTRGGGGSNEIDSAAYLSSITPLSAKEINNLHRHTLVIRRVVRMTTKGKVASMYALVVAGNGRGLVGYGEGKDTNAGKAARKAFHEAVKRMDYVKRLEGRTIHTESTSKWGSSHVTIRPRPAGFGLRVPPVIHSLARAAGLSDLSASIQGSSNPLNVIKAACQILWQGSNPIGLGDGVGGRARRNDRGRGMPDLREIELARGRKLREVQLGRSDVA
ncbi:hypothetical protein K437DRAFT_275720 [Tilletiaria anomala UBC 951]|uniref:Small ribosomal subunit protein uS5m n=1 Tax=Tilletiaria anomala (strain ATCC 24038 / CBS 436.72 / UBC 951) TaxID=1037660 RepID=A0A066VJF3_TILAU|nr:uncharacterized protein K437DRAFT_275720 [Tilletiaria anomala UBC 951]KDN40433.1 hypothetical protein K437DRAFT_275720 [Tilletiaria anomala UBC 951]